MFEYEFGKAFSRSKAKWVWFHNDLQSFQTHV